MRIFLYGPPGSGKSSSGQALAGSLDLPFYDLDREIEARCGDSVAGIFAARGEAGFRRAEREALLSLLQVEAGVVALGGGALLDGDSRVQVEASGTVFCLHADLPALLARLESEGGARPLLSGDLANELEALLARRQAHYAAFPEQVDASGRSPAEVAWQIQTRLGRFRLKGMGAPYDALIQSHSLPDLGRLLQERGLEGPVVLVSDEQVAQLYAGQCLQALAEAGYACQAAILPKGEQHKNLASVSFLWERFLAAGLERGSTVVALGGGVVTDLAGFAAGAYLRGVRWVAAPTSLLGMVDASLGGKTGIDLPQGKNLAGLFHPPSLVLSDPALLASLAAAEVRNGMAEALKHGVIGDAGLAALCQAGGASLAGAEWEPLIRRAAAVKIQMLLDDPFEQGLREVLNFGHTVGHALEQASGYRLRHGEAVAIGMVVESRLAQVRGLAEPGTSEAIQQALEALGLPVHIPIWIDREAMQAALLVDKKRRSGKARLSLPARIGAVRYGCEIDEEALWEQCLCCMDPT